MPNDPPAPAPIELPENLSGISSDDPYRLARLFLGQYEHTDGPTLRFWAQQFAIWTEGAYDRVEEETIRGELVEFVEAEFVRDHAQAYSAWASNGERGGDTGKKPPQKCKVTRGLISDVLQALRSLTRVATSLVPPCWVDQMGPHPAECIAARNGVLHIPAFLACESGSFISATPRYLSCNRVAFDIDLQAPEPTEWLRFLNQLWPDDPDSIACLQEWFGYLLTPDARLHKMLMVVGPPRAGKGTIGRVLEQLVGKRNCAAPTLGQLDQQFSLCDLLDKTVAIVADARLSGRADAVAITEQLLSISGQDARMVDRKFLPPITTTLNTRFVFLSNELPRFGDASSAIVNRFVILRLTESFLGREDPELLQKLIPELPGILLWALDGWMRLRQFREFTQPESARELIDDAEALASPIRLFLDERCEVGPEHTVTVGDLYGGWQRWCQAHGRDKPGSMEMFSRDLRAALPTLRKTRPREGEKRVWAYEGIRLLSDYEAGDIPV